MKFFSLLGIELQKIRRSHILWILMAAAVILWLPSILNADLNFQMQAEGIAPEYNFFIQGFLAMSWFMFPASMVVATVLLSQTEQTNHGILKMRSLPVQMQKLCLAKLAVLFFLSAVQVLMSTGMYYLSAAIVTRTQNYPFGLPPCFVLKEAAFLLLSAVPMLTVFWLFSVSVPTPAFSIGIGLASIVPSILIINTKIWYIDPMAYPFFVVTAEYGKLASHLTTEQVAFVPWLPVAAGITVTCILISCVCFGKSERR